MSRTSTAKIIGTNYIPPIPFETKIKSEITKMPNRKPSFDVAIDLMLYVMKTQPTVIKGLLSFLQTII